MLIAAAASTAVLMTDCSSMWESAAFVFSASAFQAWLGMQHCRKYRKGAVTSPVCLFLIMR